MSARFSVVALIAVLTYATLTSGALASPGADDSLWESAFPVSRVADSIFPAEPPASVVMFAALASLDADSSLTSVALASSGADGDGRPCLPSYADFLRKLREDLGKKAAEEFLRSIAEDSAELPRARYRFALAARGVLRSFGPVTLAADGVLRLRTAYTNRSPGFTRTLHLSAAVWTELTQGERAGAGSFPRRSLRPRGGHEAGAAAPRCGRGLPAARGLERKGRVTAGWYTASDNGLPSTGAGGTSSRGRGPQAQAAASILAGEGCTGWSPSRSHSGRVAATSRRPARWLGSPTEIVSPRTGPLGRGGRRCVSLGGMDCTKTAGVEMLAPYARGDLEFGIVSLTGPEAQVVARDLACEDSRELDVEYVGELRDILERDEWVGRDGLVFVAGDHGHLTLIDGRHRLHAHGERERLADGPVRREWLVQVVRGIEPRKAYRRIQRQNPFQGHARA